MNVADSLPPFAKQILPMLKLVGIDPSKVISGFERHALEPLMMRQTPHVVSDLEVHGLVPSLVAGDLSLTRQMIRSVMFQTIKAALPTQIPGRGHVADLIRDNYDDKVVARTSPLVKVGMGAEEAVKLVVQMTLEQMF